MQSFKMLAPYLLLGWHFLFTHFLFTPTFSQERNCGVKQGLFRTENGVFLKYLCVKTGSVEGVFAYPTDPLTVFCSHSLGGNSDTDSCYGGTFFSCWALSI